MFCNQCEQAKNATGCDVSPGICGKDEDIQSLQEMLLYGVKGMCAYAHHARRLGATDPAVDEFVERALFSTMTNVNFDLNSALGIVLECGEKNLRVMQMLDEAHVATFGKPEPTTVQHGTSAGPGIVCTGHDMLMLKKLLDACAGTDVKVYTHGEMLPAHMYPKLRAHPNLAGHYGGAWQKQKGEFGIFPGAIVANTNCIQIPTDKYKDRMFTVAPVAAAGATIVDEDDLATVVAKAQELPPCPEETLGEIPVGFHHSVLAQQAAAIVDGVKAGQISHFFVIGGCDGREAGRDYFTEYAEAVPEDAFILTMGCGKYRIMGKEYGTHLGLPRLMDMGQCNDSYGAIQIALALAEAFDCTVNDLPLTLCISWFEQKAVAVLLTLLHLGVKGISIGPNPPAWVTPTVFKALQDQFDLRLTGTDAKADVAAAMA
ncbi:MAG: hydroxylamine reductase [Planctomycetota bacterium]